MTQNEAILNLWVASGEKSREAEKMWDGMANKGAVSDAVKKKLATVIENTAYLLALLTLPEAQQGDALSYLTGNNDNPSQAKKRHCMYSTVTDLFNSSNKLRQAGFNTDAEAVHTITTSAYTMLTKIFGD